MDKGDIDLTRLAEKYSIMLQDPVERSDEAYLRRLGSEVRRLRRERKLNRKHLAVASGVSERFLAQLEGGTGNISVLRLRHIAQALECPVGALLEPDNSGAIRSSRKSRIALIGLRGAGKTTLGTAVAKELNLPFIELTDRIERSNGMSLPDIFNLYGQEGYRRLEHRELSNVIKAYDSCMLAAAGGVSEQDQTFDLLLDNFYTIWLTAAPEDHMNRVVAQGDLRPMDGHQEALAELKTILGSRAHDYARADHIVETGGRAIDEVSAELVGLINRF